MSSIRHIRAVIALSERIIAVLRVFRPGLSVAGMLLLASTLQLSAQTDPSAAPLTKEEKAYQKQDEKAWKKAKNKMEPLEFKKVVQEHDAFKIDIEKYKEILEKIQAELDLRMAEISDLKAQNAKQKSLIDSLRLANSAQEALLASAAGPGVMNFAPGQTGVAGAKGYNYMRKSVPAGSSPATDQTDALASDAVKASSRTVTGGAGNAVASAANAGPNMQALPEGVVFKVQIGAFRNRDLQKYLNNSRNFTGEVDEDGVKKYTLGFFADYWEADNFKKYMRELGVNDAWIVTYKQGKRVPIKDVLENAV